MTLSVLNISTADNLGGSGRSAYKVHRGLRDLGVRSRMLVRDQVTSDRDVQRVNPGWFRLADKAAAIATDRLGLQYLFVPSSLNLLRHPWYRSADVVQLYNTHGNYFSHTVLPRMCRDKMVVWRLSDMWPLTGHCAYAGSCDRWKHGCGKCPDLASYPPLRLDTTGLLWKRKQSIYSRSSFHVVAPSRWLLNLVDQSPLLRGRPRTLIRNGVDTAVFKPLGQAWCRQVLGVPERGKGILFLGHVVADNERKGSGFFLRVIEALDRSGAEDFFVMVVGEGAGHFGEGLPCPVWRHDLVREDELLALIYNAADLLVHPATAENLPNSVLEAMACGVPAAAFDAGGVAEIVVSDQTGWLAPPGNVEHLTAGVRSLLSDDGRRAALGRTARAIIEAEYTVARQARSFYDLYESCLRHRSVA
ncbi:hypothetical protein AYO44_10660 [Planctomycetaceae bacterium SCGC AG-212-F19]|nr:hypothetical protein AYO44_10660 [Planctomycetaceae bacterium SCGC AG-212-F19]